MRALLFVICFTTGVTLMLVSGYVPRGAVARDGASPRGNASESRTRFGPRAGRLWTPSLGDVSSDTNETEDANDLPLAGDEPEGGDATSPPTASQPPTAVEVETAATSAPEAVEDTATEPLHTDAATPEVATPETPEAVAEPPNDEPAADPSLGDEPAEQLPPKPTSSPPVANAGPDRIVWNGWDDVALDARGSQGEDLLFEWRQVSGPTQITFEDAYAGKTKASGMLRGPGAGWTPLLYQFEVSVIDSAGREASDTIEVVAIAAPELTVRPAATRSFENRDGYWLGHYAAQVRASTDIALFEISAPTQLIFTHVGAAAAEVSTVSTGDANVYEIVIYRSGDEQGTQTEYLVDTDEQIPGVLRLSVTWEAP